MFVFSRVCYVTWYNVMGIRVTFQHRSVAFLPVRYIYVYIYMYVNIDILALPLKNASPSAE